MNDTVVNEVRRAFYLDSVALMRCSRAIADLDGVLEAALMMGTPANRELMSAAGLLADEAVAAGGGDLIVGIRAASTAAAEHALAEARRLLAAPSSGADVAVTSAARPRTLRRALDVATNANLALISVPGSFAAGEARKALRAGLNVMIFSDNVDIADEAALKQEARALGRLIMGPDCGTAIIHGVPLGFANVVPPGDIGVVGASGTGMQEVTTLIARCGGGISQAIGVGGRDLDERVGGVSTLMALDALEADERTRHVVLLAKPPAPTVAGCIIERIAESSKPHTVCFLGARMPSLPRNARAADTLKQAAERALGVEALFPALDPARLAGTAPKHAGRAHGLFSGGTLCAEAQVVFRAAGEAVASNAPIPGADGLDTAGHPMIDLGDDEYTRGRPHPMIDPAVRDAAVTRALEDAGTAVLLLDLVIGHGAHEDPAGHLATLLARPRRGDHPIVIASVTGTEADPQGRQAQIAKLEAAGVLVAPSNADAATLALAVLRGAR